MLREREKEGAMSNTHRSVEGHGGGRNRLSEYEERPNLVPGRSVGEGDFVLPLAVAPSQVHRPAEPNRRRAAPGGVSGGGHRGGGRVQRAGVRVGVACAGQGHLARADAGDVRNFRRGRASLRYKKKREDEVPDGTFGHFPEQKCDINVPRQLNMACFITCCQAGFCYACNFKKSRRVYGTITFWLLVRTT